MKGYRISVITSVLLLSGCSGGFGNAIWGTAEPKPILEEPAPIARYETLRRSPADYQPVQDPERVTIVPSSRDAIPEPSQQRFVAKPYQNEPVAEKSELYNSRRVIARASMNSKSKLANEQQFAAPTPSRAPAMESQAIARSTLGTVKPGWYVQVAAETESRQAISRIARLRTLGVDGQVQKAVVQDTLYYRVLVGPYASKSRARGQIGVIRGYGVSKGKPFLKQVK